MTYDDMLIEADANNLITKDKPLIANDGRIKGNKIAIRKNLTRTEKKCVLAEEIGHYHTTVGDIIQQSSVADRKQELQARIWAYNRLIGLTGIINSYKAGYFTLHDMAEYLEVTEEFLNEALMYYKSKYGECVQVNNYAVCFEPSFGILELKSI